MVSNSEKRKPSLASLKIDPELRRGEGNKNLIVWVVGTVVAVIVISALAVILKERTVEVKTTVVRQQQAGQGLTVLNASGYVTPRRRATVAAKITGQVVKMLAEEGMEVEKGQVLAQLDDAEAKARFNASKADLKVARAQVPELELSLTDAERDLSRISNLFSKKIASQEDLDKAKITVERFRAQLSRLREQVLASQARLKVSKQVLEDFTIRSPFAGIIVSKDAQIGEMVSPVSAGGGYTRTGIATIVDMDSLEIEVDVNESYIANVAVGQNVIATLDAYPEWTIPSTVRTIIPTADRQKATVKVRIAFDKLDQRILPDMGVKVAFMSKSKPSQASASVSVVLKAAIRDVDGKSIAFVCNGYIVERRSIKTGRAVGNTVEVLAGLTGGEHVVVEGPDDLKDGQKVVIKKD
jgi:RND family efflux transporter MFP subunit